MKRKILFGFIAIVIIILGFMFISKENKNDTVVVFSVMEDFRDTELQKQFKEKLPEVTVVLQHLSSGSCAAKLKAESVNTEADIVVGFETAYMEELKNIFEPLTEYDTSEYIDGLNPVHKRYLIWDKYSGVIVVNTEQIKEHNLLIPANYDDLTNPIYKNQFVMPDPKTSGTAYMFLYERAKALGEENAIKYFDKLAKNTRQFTVSGSSPVNLLVQGECSVGWGIINKIVSEINEGAPLKMIVPPTGAPYALEGFGIIKGRKNKKNVKKVFDFLYSDFIHYDKEYFSPDQIFKVQDIKIKNYPKNIKYADMEGFENMDTKKRLLDNWNF